MQRDGQKERILRLWRLSEVFSGKISTLIWSIRRSTENIDRMVGAGYSMLTIDMRNYDQDDVNELQSINDQLPWDELNESPQPLLKRILIDSI